MKERFTGEGWPEATAELPVQSSFSESSQKPHKRHQNPTPQALHWGPQDWDSGTDTLGQILKPRLSGSYVGSLSVLILHLHVSTWDPMKAASSLHRAPWAILCSSVTWGLDTIAAASSLGTGKQLSGCLRGESALLPSLCLIPINMFSYCSPIHTHKPETWPTCSLLWIQHGLYLEQSL